MNTIFLLDPRFGACDITIASGEPPAGDDLINLISTFLVQEQGYPEPNADIEFPLLTYVHHPFQLIALEVPEWQSPVAAVEAIEDDADTSSTTSGTNDDDTSYTAMVYFCHDHCLHITYPTVLFGWDADKFLEHPDFAFGGAFFFQPTAAQAVSEFLEHNSGVLPCGHEALRPLYRLPPDEAETADPSQYVAHWDKIISDIAN